MNKKDFDFHLKIKQFSYDVVRMEECENGENFWIFCGRFSRGLTEFFYCCDKNNMGISDICIFLHKRCMKNGGEYSKYRRIVGNHYPPEPDFIKSYMNLLDENYRYFAFQNISSLPARMFFSLEYIHPFSDGNGRVGKALFAILNNNLSCKVKTHEQHTALCRELERLQRSVYVFDDHEYNNHLFNKLQNMLN